MSKRRTCHDRSVRKRASGLKSHGWSVSADISGFSKPKTINGSRPDIYATKGKKTLVYEVETKNSMDKDKKQHKNLKRYAKSIKNTQFKIGIC